MAHYTYCPRCNKDVEVIEVSMGTRGGGATLRCAECGAVLAEKDEKSPDERLKLTRVITAGYSDIQNDLIIAALVRNQYADVLEGCSSGEELLVKTTNLLYKRAAPKLLMLEVNMPIMNGINAALCLRSIEKGISASKIPILFFTQKPLDEMFTKAIKFLTPAKYVPLPPNVDIETFRKRVDQIAELLKSEKW